MAKKYCARVRVPLPLPSDPQGWMLNEIFLDGIVAPSESRARARAMEEAERHCVSKFMDHPLDEIGNIDFNAIPDPQIIAISRLKDGVPVKKDLQAQHKKLTKVTASQRVKSAVKSAVSKVVDRPKTRAVALADPLTGEVIKQIRE